MPRPKRAKVASNAPSSRVASFTQMSQSTANAIEKPKTRRNAARINKVAPEVAADVVVAARSNVKRSRAAWEEADGGLAEPSAVERLKRRRSGASGMQSMAVVDRVESSIRSVNASEPVAARSSSPREIEQPRRQARSSSTRGHTAEILRQRTPVAARAPNTDDLYGLSPQGEKSQLQLQEQIQDGRLSLAEQCAPSSADKVQPTPMHEASLLALKNFKRRIRQPSILRTGRLSMQSTTQVDLGFSDLDDFQPDDESTPLHLSKYAADDALDNTDMDSPPATTSRKRMLSELAADIQTPRSSPPLDSQIDDAIELMNETIARDRPSSPPPVESDLPDYVPETAHNTQQNHEKEWSDTMAEPKSSSSIAELDSQEVRPVQPVKTNNTTRRTRKHSKATAERDKGAALNLNKRPQAPSTAALQNLLPQRRNDRQRRRAKPDTFDIPSDSDAVSSEDDSPAREPARKGNQRRKTHNAPVKKSKHAARSPLASARKSTAKQPSKAVPKKTYGRQSAVSDKENDESVFDVENDSSVDGEVEVRGGKRRKSGQTVNVKQSEELKAIRDKFAEVDDWEMEFESVEAGGEGSSWR